MVVGLTKCDLFSKMFVHIKFEFIKPYFNLFPFSCLLGRVEVYMEEPLPGVILI